MGPAQLIREDGGFYISEASSNLYIRAVGAAKRAGAQLGAHLAHAQLNSGLHVNFSQRVGVESGSWSTTLLLFSISIG